MFTKPMARALAAFGLSSGAEAPSPEPEPLEIATGDLNLDQPAEALEALRRAALSNGPGESPSPVQPARVPPHLRHIAAGVDQSLAVYADKQPRRGGRARSIAPGPRVA